ncbi:uncharacterized protein LOC127737311 [Mytilus californianus]|uniref:uncharacterized protein LOC127737311 n=1 Tax=Mytilus californianus TaxID=6549 RepID=UPI002246015B|nr:uncharacterized protein LOC127737311 [Mytilus californianus]
MKFLILIVVLVAILFQCMANSKDIAIKLKPNWSGDVCLSGYHYCNGSIWCCPDGYECTGTVICPAKENEGLLWGLLSPILVLVIAFCCVVCYRGCRDKPSETVLQPKLVHPQAPYSQL